MIAGFLNGFKMAFCFLTTIPLFSFHEFKKEYQGYAVACYGIIGLLLGWVVYLAALLFSPVFPPLLLKTMLFAMFIALNGGLHLDGFIDTLDGIFCQKSAAEALAIMKSSSVGGLGVVFLVLFLLLKLFAFISLQSLVLFVFIPALSRLFVSFAIYRYPYVSVNGIAAGAKEEFGARLLLFSTIFTAAACLAFAPYKLFFAALFISLGATLLICSTLKAKFGGLSGDMYGFLIELNELILLIFMVTAEHAKLFPA